MSPELPPPCLACGSCCFSKLTDYVRIEGADHDRMGDRADELTTFIGNRCYMKMIDEHCAALVIDLVQLRFVCSIYEERPKICRELARAGPACHAEIHEKRERPLAALLALGKRA